MLKRASQLRASVGDQFRAIRSATEAICAPLEIEDHVVQAMADVSPPKWHMAHTTWFFETFVLEPFAPGYRAADTRYRVLFNSYYQGVGAQHPRAERGNVSRPTVDGVLRYRARIDEAMAELIESAPSASWDEIGFRIVLGCNHEQQHQELLYADIKYNLFTNPGYPVYRDDLVDVAADGARPLGWTSLPGGIVEVGARGGFCYDNETPRHRALIDDFRVADRLVTNGEWLAFIEDGGYQRVDLWLADGWATVCEAGWDSPLYWVRDGDDWCEFTLGGLRPLSSSTPAVHVSYYEADAYARWAGARLPTEFEWEVAAGDARIEGNTAESDALHPQPATAGADQMFGDVWEHTASAYAPYPGYRPLAGALGEYNAKFMCSEQVLRGGSCVTPADHLRASYRNYFYPHQRWNFQGVRLADGID